MTGGSCSYDVGRISKQEERRYMAKEESYIAESMVVWRRPQQYVQVPAYPFKRPKSPDFSFGISMFNSRTRHTYVQ